MLNPKKVNELMHELEKLHPNYELSQSNVEDESDSADDEENSDSKKFRTRKLNPRKRNIFSNGIKEAANIAKAKAQVIKLFIFL